MKLRLLFCILLLVISGCGAMEGSRTVRYPNAITPEAQARFDAADKLYRSSRFAEADAQFAKIIAELPYTELTDEARFRRGEIAFAKKDYNSAIAFYGQAVSQIASPKVAPKAHFKAALALYKLNRPQETLGELAQIGRKDSSAVLRLRADSLGVKASKAAGLSANSSISWNLFLLDDYSEAKGTESTGIPKEEIVSEDAATTEVRRWIGDNTVTLEEVEALPMKFMKGKRSGGFAAYKLALVYHMNGDTKAASRQLKSYISTYPKHEYYGAARLLLGEMGGEIGDASGIVVGVILPLSGKYATYGESTLHGIECAVGVYEPCTGPGGVKLIIRDSEASPTAAVQAVDELAAEKVVAIVGPLASASALDAANRAQELGIPTISLSQRDGVAEVGDYIFRNSVSDKSEMSTLANFAVNQMRLRRFYIVYPPNKKGSEYKQLFTEAIGIEGGSIAGAKSFSPPSQVNTIDELRGRYLTENRGGPKGETPEEMGLDLPPTDGGYDALFVADSLGIANFIAQKLSFSGSDRKKLLGISRWGDQAAVSRTGPSVEGAVFVDSFFKGTPDPLVSGFVTKFKDAYGTEPTLLEALGYDAMKLILNAVQEKGAVRRDSIRDALARTSGFHGVTGKITFDAEGDAAREMWVLAIKNGAIELAQ